MRIRNTFIQPVVLVSQATKVQMDLGAHHSSVFKKESIAYEKTFIEII